MSRRKAGMCKCGHELRRFHDDAGVCTYGEGTVFAGACAREHGGPCAKPRKKRATMNGTTKQTRAITVDGDKVLRALKTIRGAFAMIDDELGVLIEELARGGVRRSKEVSAMLDAPRESPAGESRVHHTTNGSAAAGARSQSSTGGAASDLGTGPLAVLLAIAQWGSPTPEVLVLATGYRATSVQTYLGELSQRALITRDHGQSQLTSDGAALLAARWGDPLPPRPRQRELLERWLVEFGEGPAAVLRAIAEAGRPLTPSELLELTKYKATSIQTYLGELSTPHVIKRAGGRAWLHRELGGPLDASRGKETK